MAVMLVIMVSKVLTYILDQNIHVFVLVYGQRVEARWMMLTLCLEHFQKPSLKHSKRVLPQK